MGNESTQPFPPSSFNVVRSGPWDPKTFGIVQVSVVEKKGNLEAIIESEKDPQIYFKIKAYERQGSYLFLKTTAWRWIFRAVK